jgi:hypothetical protein
MSYLRPLTSWLCQFTATSFRIFSNECLEHYLPRQADLIILEHLPHTEDPTSFMIDTERFLNRLWLHLEAPHPAMIFINSYLFPMPLGVDGKPHGSHSSHCTNWHKDVCSNCTARLRDDNTGSVDDINMRIEEETHKLAEHYGLASLSLYRILSNITASNSSERRGLTECEILTRLYRDRAHPAQKGEYEGM